MTVGSLFLREGTITGAGTLAVATSFKWKEGAEHGSTMSGPGKTVIQPTATCLMEPSGGTITERTFVNEGTATLEWGYLLMSEGAKLENKGLFNANSEANSETEPADIAIAEGSKTQPAIVNSGTFQKSYRNPSISRGTRIGVPLTNTGAVKDSSTWILDFLDGATSSGAGNEWAATNSEASINLRTGSYSFVGSTWAGPGKLQLEAAATVDEVQGPTANLFIQPGGSMSVLKGSMTLAGLNVRNSTLTGAGNVTATATFAWEQGGTLSGSGTMTVAPGVTAGKIEGGDLERTLINEGTLAFNAGNETIHIAAGAELENLGLFEANSERGSLVKEAFDQFEGAGKIVNVGRFEKTKEGQPYTDGHTIVGVFFENFGKVTNRAGGESKLELLKPITVRSASTRRGCEQIEAAAKQEREGQLEEESETLPPTTALDQEAAVCAAETGNFTQSESDFAIGGRGVGLSFARTYNSQAAAEGVTGPFGYGWSSSFSDHVVSEPEGKQVTVVQANGSTVPFAEGAGGALAAPKWSQDRLTGSISTGYVLTLPDQTVYRFAGGSGRLESVTDRNGNVTTLAYEGAGRLESIEDPAGRKIKLLYNAEGHVESATDPRGFVVKYTYAGGNLASVTEPGEEALRWQFPKYDSVHELTELTDGRGGKTTVAYDSAYRMTEETDPSKRTTAFEYLPFETRVVNRSTGSVMSDNFTSNGETSAITRGYGTTLATTEKNTYDAAGDLRSSTDGNGHTTTYTYDEHANRTSMVDPLEHETKWTYDSTHDVETETTPSGETTTYKRDSHGNPELIERPAPGGLTQTTKYVYNGHGQPTSMEDPLKRVWKYEYDNAGDKTAEIDPEGDKRTWGYNEDSEETSTVSPRGHVAGGKEATYTTTTIRDAQGRQTEITDPLKHVTKYSYDADGNLRTKTDAELNVTTYSYNADNELEKTEEPEKNTTATSYDGAGQVETQTDGNKQATTYTRNILEQVSAIADPLGHRTKKEYDAAGNLTSLTDPLSRTTTYKYDAANHLTEVSYSSGNPHSVTYKYDPDGSRTEMIDGAGTTKYEYDQLDRLTATINGHEEHVGYQYDLANQQTAITYPNGKVVKRGYDATGRLKLVTDWGERTSEFAYDANSNLTAITFPSTSTNKDSYTYEADDVMKEVKFAKGAETLGSLVYVHNKDLQVTKATTLGLPGEEKPAFAYDNNNRLTKGALVTYKYDGANNPTTIGKLTYTYNAASQPEGAAESKTPKITYAYDALGERTNATPTSGAATVYEYDQAQDLTSVMRKEGTSPIEDTYGYNGDRLRISQTVSGSTSYLAWDLSANLSLLLADGADSYIYGPAGLALEQIPTGSAEVAYLHHDQQGSTRLITNSSGENGGSVTYDAYGNVLARGGGSGTTRLGYDGQYTDADTGLIYARARSYDPATAQFLSVDVMVEQTLTPYSFANDDPLTFGDPSGESAGCPAGCYWKKPSKKEVEEKRRREAAEKKHNRHKAKKTCPKGTVGPVPIINACVGFNPIEPPSFPVPVPSPIFETG
jgi:RHS repeat-associated protein